METFGRRYRRKEALVPTHTERGKLFPSRRATTLGSFGLTAALALLLTVGVTAQQAPANSAGPTSLKVTITVDGETRELETTASKTVSELLAEHKIAFGNDDRCTVPTTSALTDGLKLTITRVRVETVTEKTPIPFTTHEVLSPELRVGAKIVKIPGKDGEKAITYRDYYKDGKRTERTKLDEKVTPATQALVLLGTQGMTLSSRGFFGSRRMIEMTATGYGPSGNGRYGMHTATGIRPRYGIVAVDPRIIPLGTKLFVEGYGYAIAADTGSAIKGMRIDLFYESDGRASQVGRKKVRVLILEPGR
jgi:3D (Asp-Asp-Asp) domain-containing protein